MSTTTANLSAVRSRWLPVGPVLLALAGGTYGWTLWKSEYAWRSGYGDGGLVHIHTADPAVLSGGHMTTFHKGYKPFGQPADNLPWQYAKRFVDGDGLFEQPCRAASGRDPSTVKAGGVATKPEGLGPLNDADACGACDFCDGPVETPYQTGEPMKGIFLRLSVPDGKGGYMAPPGYHAQLRDKSVGLAKAQEVDPDGVSGRPNWVTDPEAGARVIGRFFLNANEASLPGQSACGGAPKNGGHGHTDLKEEQLQVLTTYLQLLAVPARRNVDDARVQRGERLFADIRCNACHVDTLKTGGTHPITRLRGQTIHPYSDLLLHDMGPGLAGRPDNDAGPTEWRTPPLWGIGLTRRSNHHSAFLHDQRARNLTEAIRWHEGEAAPARARFMGLSRLDRVALITFLESL